MEMSLNYIDKTSISFAAEVIQMFPSLLLKLGLQLSVITEMIINHFLTKTDTLFH